MRPEKKQVQLELTEEEKAIVALLKASESAIDLGELKIKSALSGKKWDAAMKGLTKHGLVKVVVNGDYKVVELTA
jgi:lysyl-tRNA synthetase class 2